MEHPACGHENREGARFCDTCGAPLAPSCANCGAALRPSARFCDACGASVAGLGAARTPTPAPAAVLPSGLAGGRYTVQRLLGEGGRKRVYLAHDNKLDRDVAVAVIKTEGLDDAGLSRVRREAQAMGRLGDHPNIVTIHDIGDESPSAGSGQASQPYIVSQYMAGGSLADLLRQAENQRLPVEQALRIAGQICAALEYAHSRGIIHRDVKPANIWLAEDPSLGPADRGRTVARLGDFGLAVTLELSRVTAEGMMVGTAAYMAPEQVLGQQADVRSDLYSLGCVLYEMVTGRPPFLGDDAVSVISQHINTAPLGPAWLNPEVPRALDRYVRGLLTKAPEERPASATEVRTALAEIAEAPAAGAGAEPVAAPGRLPVRGYRRSPFVGREKELAQLKERLEDAVSGRGSVVMLVGEPGIGKTRLSEELSVYARLRGAQVLMGQCYESEGAPPYVPFIEALRQYVNARPAESLRQEMGDGASDLARLVSEVRTRLPELPHSPPEEPETERYRLLEAVTSFLVNASQANPLLLILDDIHWADKPSLLMLEHLARRLSDSRILVIGTYRDVELDRQHPLSEVLAQLRRERLYERVLLRGLDGDGVHSLISRRVEYEAPRAVTDVLYEQTEGNPFFVEEILFHLYETGAFTLQGGQYVAPAGLAEIIPEGVREVIGRRLSRLSKATNQALALGSVLGREFDFDVLQTLSEMDDEALLSALEEALRAHLVTEHKGTGGTAYRFSHALVQETLYGELSIARKQRLHLRAGRALEQARAGRLEPYVSQLAHHFYQGNEPVKATDYAQRAAEAAVKVYAWEEAVRHWETALELMEEQGADEGEQARLMERVGDATYISGIDVDKGTQYLERALAIYERTGASGKVAAMHSRLGRGLVTYFGRLDLEKGPAHLEAARAILEEDAPDSAGLAYVYIGLCTACLFRAEMEEGIVHSRRALEIGERRNSRPVTAIALVFTGNFLAHMGELREGLEMIERGWAMADEDGLTFVASMGAVFSGSHHVFNRSDPREGKRWLQRELAKPGVATARFLRGQLQGPLHRAHIMAGEMDEARRLGEGEPTGALLIASGEWGAAEERLLDLSKEYSQRGVAMGPDGFLPQLGELCFRSGELDRAEEHLRASGRALQQARASASNSRLTLAQVLARAGRLKEAQKELDECASFLAGGEDWGGTVGHLALARGAVASAKGKWPEAEEAFGEALAVGRQYGLPWDEADALREQARMHLARGEPHDRAEALRLLDETIAIYQRLGAKKHLELVLADKLAAQGLSSTDALTSIDRVAASVDAEHPDLRPHAAPDGTVTIMFSDIEGSTDETVRLGDKAWMEVLREHNAIVREQIKAHAGFEVKSEGDGFMVAFQSAGKALECAAAIQEALAERNARRRAAARPRRASGRGERDDDAATEPLKVRMGLHAGEVIKEGEDFFGRNVIMAARVASQARGGEILVSGVMKGLLGGWDVAWGEKRTAELKGLPGEHEIWSVAWGRAQSFDSPG